MFWLFQMRCGGGRGSLQPDRSCPPLAPPQTDRHARRQTGSRRSPEHLPREYHQKVQLTTWVTHLIRFKLILTILISSFRESGIRWNLRQTLPAFYFQPFGDWPKANRSWEDISLVEHVESSIWQNPHASLAVTLGVYFSKLQPAKWAFALQENDNAGSSKWTLKMRTIREQTWTNFISLLPTTNGECWLAVRWGKGFHSKLFSAHSWIRFCESLKPGACFMHA